MKRTQIKAVLKSAIPDASGNVYLTQDGQETTTDTAPDVALNAPGGSGTDKGGGDIAICGGKPTGSGVGGSVILRTAASGGSGTTQGSLSDCVEVDPNGVMWLNAASSAPTVGKTGKVGLFVESGALKAILPDNSVETVAYEE